MISLHPKQMEVYQAPHRFRVVVAGRRWGKTALSRTLMIKYASVGGRKIWYVAPSYRMAKQIMWQEILDVIPKKWIKKLNETTMTITLINKTTIELKGADNPDSLRGVGIHLLVMDEIQDIDPNAWTQVLRPTLASTGGHALFIGTPKAYNHLHDLYILGQEGENRDTNQWMSWQFPTITSPFIPVAEIEAARRDMDEKSFRQEFEASFETMSGRVYYPFDRKVHVGTYEFNPDLPIWVGQDFNVDPMSSVILQPQANGELWAVDEIVMFGSNTEETCDALDKKYWRWKNNIVVFPDPASNSRQHARGETDLDIFREKGFKKILFRRKHPAVADRINSVNALLKNAQGEIRFKVNSKCKHLIESLEETIYKKGEREVDKAQSKEHSTDALGYAIEHQYSLRKVQVGGLSI
jgi:hypothetical protein